MTNPGKRTDLSFQGGGSDKVYQVELVLNHRNGEFDVNYAYGRRGATFNTGSKTPNPVSYAKAERIFDKLVASKVAKGYLIVSETTSPVKTVPPIQKPVVKAAVKMVPRRVLNIADTALVNGMLGQLPELF